MTDKVHAPTKGLMAPARTACAVLLALVGNDMSTRTIESAGNGDFAPAHVTLTKSVQIGGREGVGQKAIAVGRVFSFAYLC